MEIKFIGTGAADWDWTLPLQPGIRGSTSTLLDGHILIDAGPTVTFQLSQLGIPFSQITDLLLTHSHSDHFNVADILELAAAPRDGKLRVYASKEAIARLGNAVEGITLAYGETYTVGNLAVKALPANHVVENPFENTYHFIVHTPEGKCLYYALDGGWMTSAERGFLMGESIDMLVWDATSGTCLNNWRFADHNELWMIHNMRQAMAPSGIISSKTKHIFNHIARTLWPTSPEERLATCKKFDGTLAEDGMIVNL